MSFLSRLRARRKADAGTAEQVLRHVTGGVYVLGPLSRIQADWTPAKHLDALVAWLQPGRKNTMKEARVELVRDRDNPRDPTSIVVVKDHATIGAVPSKCARKWAQFIDEQNRQGQRVVANARAWSYMAPGHYAPNISLYLDIPCDPAEYDAAKVAAETAKAAAAWRAAGLCVECGAPVEKKGGKGSAVRCGQHAAERKASLVAAKVRQAARGIPTYRCAECGDEYTDDEISSLGPLYECRECDTVFAPLASEGRSNRCPDCNRPSVKIAALGCSGCSEGRVARIDA